MKYLISYDNGRPIYSPLPYRNTEMFSYKQKVVILGCLSLGFSILILCTIFIIS